MMSDTTLNGTGGYVTDCHYSGTVHGKCFEPFGKDLLKADLVATDHFRHCCFLWSCLSLSLFIMAGYTSGWKWVGWKGRGVGGGVFLLPTSHSLPFSCRHRVCFDGSVCILHGYCSVAATRSSWLSCRQAARFWMEAESDDTMNSVLHVTTNKPPGWKAEKLGW